MTVRELLEQLPVPDSRPTFFAELDERMRGQDRVSARRWRMTATTLGAVAASAIAAAATLAATLGGGSVVDRTVSCRVNSTVDLLASAQLPGKPIPADVAVHADNVVDLFEVWTDPKGYKLDGKACGKTTVTVPLAQAGLPRDVVLRSGDYATFSARCVLSGSVLLHARVHRSSSGEPTSAELAVWRPAKPKPRPLAYIRWTPSLIRTYLARACGG